ncbi:MAG: UDP-N-acetylmuramoyl-tripeptide--D-alanyl-D-alanine ligase [Saprospiraceae bacterium]|nr:UDP-N-acetylmuramoyl-tripeptide--D-alanyl-D-alanine ligase [Saprospiraceae bacterium]
MISIEDVYQIFLTSGGVCIDSRKVTSNDIFIALKGEHVDGHKFVKQVIDLQDTHAIIDDKDYYINERTILVDNVLSFLQKLAQYHRAQFDIPVLGITGSNGKTTTKELIYQVLSTQFNVHSTKGNYNNHLGVPLTLLDAPIDSDILIIEMGANHVGEINDLSHIACPTLGLITNIGEAHIEGFGSVEGIIQGKTELYKYLHKTNGSVFINRNDETLMKELPRGIDHVFYPSENIIIQDSGLNLEIRSLDSGKIYNSSLYGIYNAINIQAAVTIGEYFKIDLHKILEAIANYHPNMNRSQIVRSNDNVLIMDAYNANPTSMKEAIKSMAALEGTENKVLVLGDMKELGIEEVQYHQDIVDFLSNYSWQKVFLVGSLFKQTKNNSFNKFENVDQLIQNYEAYQESLKGSAFLLKASRSIQLEKFKEAFF